MWPEYLSKADDWYLRGADDYDDEDRYYAEIKELESFAALMMDVETYDDYFVS